MFYTCSNLGVTDLAPTSPSNDLTRRLVSIVEALRRLVAAEASRRWMFAPVALILWPYLHRVCLRFERIIARLRAGRRGVRTRNAPRTGQTCLKQHARLPRGFGWVLTWLGPEAACIGSQLRQLLAEPDMAALLDTQPQAAKSLRPLCRMLAIAPAADLPPALFQPSGRARPAAPVSSPSASTTRPTRSRPDRAAPLRRACRKPGAMNAHGVHGGKTTLHRPLNP